MEEKEPEKLIVGTAEANFFKELEKYSVPTSEEMARLIQEYHEGNLNARAEIVKRNLRLLVAPAKKYAYRTHHLEFMDFIQEGVLGMLKAIKTYNPEMGAFSFYALNMIENHMLDAIKNNEKQIKESHNIPKKSRDYKRLVEEENLTDEEICKKLHISKEMLDYLKNRENRTFMSTNQEINEERHTPLEDLLTKENELDPYEDFLNKESDKILFAFLKYILPPEEYFILYFRILIPKSIPRESLGKEIGVRGESIRKKEKKIREKLESYFKEEKIAYYEKLKLIDPNILKRMKKRPLFPKDITKYLYLKGFLTDTEYNIYYYLFIEKEYLTLNEMASLLHITVEEVKNAISNINKIKNNIDNEEFARYHEDLIKRLGFEIYRFAIYGAIPPKEDYQNKYRQKRGNY